MARAILGTKIARIPKGKTLLYKHSFSLKTAGQRALSDFEIASDELQLVDDNGHVLYRLFRNGTESQVWIDTESQSVEAEFVQQIMSPYLPERGIERPQQPLASTELLTEQTRFIRPFWELRAALRGIRVFQLSPHQVRGSGVSTPNATLERHGENLPGAADHIRRNDPEAWSRIQGAMRAIMPGLEEIQIAFTEDRRLALQFREHAVGRPWNSNEVSDGTIQALALFIALFDSRSPVLAIEEPENSLHPWILRQFLDLCRSASSKQIIMTSHSPVLLDYVKPGVVRLLSMDRGRSVIQRFSDLSPDIADLVITGELTVFEGYDSGAIPESVPLGYRQIELAAEEEA